MTKSTAVQGVQLYAALDYKKLKSSLRSGESNQVPYILQALRWVSFVKILIFLAIEENKDTKVKTGSHTVIHNKRRTRTTG
jgi:hypothetical protein